MAVAASALETPMMKQYLSFKEKYPDAILFFRLGDFYEMFFEDAVTASEILGITLTTRHKDADIPLAGIPWHSADTHIRKLLEAGKKIAVCEQMEKPDKKKKTVERAVVRILTPGTIVEESSLVEEKSNWLLALSCDKSSAGAVWTDVSCGEVYFAQCSKDEMSDLIRMLSPKEVILASPVPGFCGEAVDEEKFDYWVPSENSVKYLESYKDRLDSQALEKALETALFYLDGLYFGNFPPLRGPERWKSEDTMSLDYNTCANLEIEKTLIGGNKEGSLLWAIDRTKTSMGRRLLSNIIKAPLKNKELILKRQTTVSTLFEQLPFLEKLRKKLSDIKDFERTLSRILVRRGGPREVLLLSESLLAVFELKKEVGSRDDLPFFTNDTPLDISPETVADWRKRFVDEPPFNYKEGGFIVPEYSEDLFELSDLIVNSKKHIAALEEKEKSATGIATLKAGFNRVFGYYFEVSKRFSDKVPPHFIRKQTTANGERYFTDELKTLEEKILNAKERLTELELEVLENTVKEIEQFESDIQILARFTAWLDTLCGFAKLAIEKNYCRPEITDREEIEIVDGRHPVVEFSIAKGSYVPAMVDIGGKDKRFSIITGPNMGGKSTIMRMTALTVLLAQCGSFVPAKSVKTGIFDSIYTRVGASDNLAKGESTFLVEMKETSAILNSATSKSLIILDEIGRGTGTYDGISLARAIAEYIIGKIGAITLFATHYHVLTELAEDFSSVVNYHMSAREYGGKIRFLYQMKEGGSSRSFGVEVAKLTDMPKEVIKNAEKILKDMERTDRRLRFESGSSLQTDIFSIGVDKNEATPEYLQDVEQVLQNIKPDEMTPRDSMNIIFKLYDLINRKEEN